MKSPPTAATAPETGDPSRLTFEQLGEAWRCAREETASAYEAWCTVPVAERRTAYAVYLAAVDRETAAELAILSTLRAA